MKKILLVLLIIPLTLLSGCTSEKKQEEQMLSLCDKVDNIVENYRDRSINSDEFISQISELEKQIQEQQQINQEQNNKIELFSKLGQVYKIASDDKQKQILNILIDKIVVSNDYSYNIKVYLNY